MKNVLTAVSALLATALLLASCESYDDVPPVTKTSARQYKLPDPEPLSPADRAVISAQEAEYSQNAQ